MEHLRMLAGLAGAIWDCNLLYVQQVCGVTAIVVLFALEVYLMRAKW